MKKIIILLITLITIFLVLNNTKAEEVIIPDESIRLRVIANSNTVEDQNIKLKVRDIVQNKIYELLKDTKDLDKARTILQNNKQEIETIIKNTLNQLNVDYSFTINFGENYFPEKEYKGVIYEEGYYESLLITLGQGTGENWWCVLFPPLCMIESTESSQELEYKFFVKQIIDKYIRKTH